MFIEQPAIWLRWLYPGATWRMDRNERSVYLTFDDGPIPESTPFILKTLAEYDAKATFFMVGENALRYHDLYNDIVAAGHRVGNHGFHHMSGALHGIGHYNREAEMANEMLKTNLFRPPHGWMKLEQYAWLSRKYRIIMWDVVTRDYSKWLTGRDVFRNIRKYTRNGSIITFHDSLKSIDKLYYALPRSLQWLKDQGYEFKVFD